MERRALPGAGYRKITGSVDLNQADIDIDKEQKKVSINFRKGSVKISNPQIGPKDIQIITIDDPNIFHKLNDKDRNKGSAAAIALLRDTALKNGIEKKTRDEAKTVIENFLEALGYQSAITFS